MCTDGRKDQEAACVRVTVSVTVALVLPNPRKGLKQSQAIKTEARRVKPDLTNHSLSPPLNSEAHSVQAVAVASRALLCSESTAESTVSGKS